MNELLVGYARVSTEQQDLTAQRDALRALGVGDDRIYVDHGLTGTNRDRPGLRLALVACRSGDTLVVTKLDRLARSLPDARDILAELTARDVRLSLGGSVHDPNDPIGRLLFNVLAMVAEFEADLIRAPSPRRHERRPRQRSPAREAAEAHRQPGPPPGRVVRLGQLQHSRDGRTVRSEPVHDLPNPAPGPASSDRPASTIRSVALREGRGGHTRPPRPPRCAPVGPSLIPSGLGSTRGQLPLRKADPLARTTVRPVGYVGLWAQAVLTSSTMTSAVRSAVASSSGSVPSVARTA